MREKAPHRDQMAFDFEGQSEAIKSLEPAKEEIIVVRSELVAETDGTGIRYTNDSNGDREGELPLSNYDLIADGYKERAGRCRHLSHLFVAPLFVCCGYILLASLKLPVAEPLNPILNLPDVSDDPRTVGAITFVLMLTFLLAAIFSGSYQYNKIQERRYRRQYAWGLPDPRFVVALTKFAQWFALVAVACVTALCIYIGFGDMLNFILSITVYLMDFDPNWPSVVTPGHAA